MKNKTLLVILSWMANDLTDDELENWYNDIYTSRERTRNLLNNVELNTEMRKYHMEN